MRRSSRSGFTLIEILIVVGIIGILVVALLATVLTARKRGDVGKAEDFVKQAIPAAITNWQGDSGKDANTYPNSPNIVDGQAYWQGTAELFEQLVAKPKQAGKEPYVSSDLYVEGTEGGKPTFLDPWNNPYIYRNYSSKKTITGKNKPYSGRRYNKNTYDIISRGPDGTLYEVEGENDDIYNGTE